MKINRTQRNLGLMRPQMLLMLILMLGLITIFQDPAVANNSRPLACENQQKAKQLSTAEEQLIKKAINKGIITNNSNNLCQLRSQVTRIEFVVMTMRNFYGDQEAKSGRVITGLFSDLDQDAWYAGYAARAKELGILRGQRTATVLPRLAPNQRINFGEAAMILTRSLEVKLPKTTPWYQGPIDYLETKRQIKPFKETHKVSKIEVLELLMKLQK